MVFRAVLIFLCLHITQTACRPVENEAKEGALNKTIDMTREKIQQALGNLTVEGLLPDISCGSLNVTEQQARSVPSCRCHIQQLSKRVPELSELLDACSQYLLDAEQLHSGQVLHVKCSLPTFQEDHYNYVYAKCLLKLVDERLGHLRNGTIPF